MIDASETEQGSTIVSDGESAEFLGQDDADIKLISGSFDTESGNLSLIMSDDSRITISGFMTSSNMGIGPTGPTGPQGKQGMNGVNGKDGKRGAEGCRGPKGDKGIKGDRGATGPTGPEGATGPSGPPGEVGPTGPAGVDGKSPSISETDTQGYEQFSQQSIKLWGVHRVDADQVLNSVRIDFERPFTNDDGMRIANIQFVGSSNVKNAVDVSEVDKDGFTVTVNTNDMPTDSTGTPLSKTGWSFNWFVIGTDF